MNTFGHLTKEMSQKSQYKLIARAEIKNYQHDREEEDYSSEQFKYQQDNQISSPDSNLTSPFLVTNNKSKKQLSIISNISNISQINKGSMILMTSIKKQSTDQLDRPESVLSLEDTINQMQRPVSDYYGGKTASNSGVQGSPGFNSQTSQPQQQQN